MCDDNDDDKNNDDDDDDDVDQFQRYSDGNGAYGVCDMREVFK